MFIDNDFKKSDPLPTTSGDGSVGNDCFTDPLWNRDVFQANRVEYGGHRLYTHLSGNDRVFHRGATYLADQMHRTKQQQESDDRWRRSMIDDLKADGFEQAMQFMADFGTNGHIFVNEYFEGRLTMRRIEDIIRAFDTKNVLNYNTITKAVEKAKRDIFAFVQFFKDTMLVPYALEQMVKCDVIETSTPIDLIGTFYDPKTGNKTWGLINIKTSESTRDNSNQLAVEYMCAKATVFDQLAQLEDLPIRLYTLRPKRWVTKPDYELVDYTDSSLTLENDVLSTYNILKKKKWYDTPVLNQLHFEGALNPTTKFTIKNFFDFQCATMPTA